MVRKISLNLNKCLKSSQIDVLLITTNLKNTTDVSEVIL